MAGDKITEAVRILAALVGVAQDPTLLSALKAGPGLRDSLKKIAASPPASFARLAEGLGRSAATVFADLREKPRDAEALYLQMVEAGLPDPARIMADRMDAAAVTDGMLAGLTEREHRDPAMQALFRALTQPALERLLADKAFAADLTPAFMRAVLERLDETQRLLEEMRRNYGTLSAALEDRRHLSRTRLEAMALRFGEPEPEGLSDADLETFLTGKAKDLRAAQAQLSALSDQGGRIANLKAAAEAAMADLRLDEARDLIRDALSVHRSEHTLRVLQEDAELVRIEAQIALLENDADEAARLLESAAQKFSFFDLRESFKYRRNALLKLYAHGRRYGGSGLERAIELCRINVAALDKEQHPISYGIMQNDLGAALATHGDRVGGVVGANLIIEAAAAHRAALSVLTEVSHPLGWAGTQNNLGTALQAQGDRVGGMDGIRLLGDAAAAYRAALRVWTEVDYPFDWAMTQSNLGSTLRMQGDRIGGAEGARLFDEATIAYRNALRIRTEKAHSVDWAATQNNLGNVLATRSERVEADEWARFLEEAIIAYRAALRVRTETAHPMDWAATQNNLGNALQAQSVRMEGVDAARLLDEAAMAYRTALRVWTELAYPVDWADAQNNLGVTLAAKGSRVGGIEGVQLLKEATAAYRAALRVRTEAVHPVAWAMTQNNLGNSLRSHAVWVDKSESAQLLVDAATAYQAALRIRTKAAHPVEWAGTIANLGLAFASLADNPIYLTPEAALNEAVKSISSALEVFDPKTMPYDYSKASMALARVRAKLAALPDPA